MFAAALAALALTAPAPADRPRNDFPALERKLHRTWVGGACQGVITFRADGTFAWNNRGPGVNTSSGTWAVKWDALPPTVSLTFVAAQNPDDVGTTWEAKILRLDDTGLTLGHQDIDPYKFKPREAKK